MFSAFINKEKVLLTPEEFKIYMENNELIVTDITYQFSEYYNIKNVYIVYDTDYSYQIEFYVVTDEEIAYCQ